MSTPKIVSHDDWLSARLALLTEEKALTRARDAVNAARRELPMVRVDREYRFDAPDGVRTLADLFAGHRQLIVYHFMFDPSWDEGCRSCSYLADNIQGGFVHFAARNTAFALVSRAPIDKLDAFKRRMGWTMPWVSSHDSRFNYDFSVTLDADVGSTSYNYQDAAALAAAGEIWYTRGELPGLSVFLRVGTEIFHTYSTYQRGLDALLNTYNYLDLTPLGRQEDEEERVMMWIRHHDRYADPVAG